MSDSICADTKICPAPINDDIAGNIAGNIEACQSFAQ
jgi:hypothetical protein